MDGPGSKTESAKQSQLSASKGTIEKAGGVAKIAVGILSVVAETTESVPYLGAISKALTAFKEVLDEVSVCKEDCKAAMRDADEFRELILKFEAKWVQLESSGEDELWKALVELGRAVLDCIETLRALKVDSPRRRDRFKLIFKREEVQASVSRCRDTMRIAKEKFNMTVALDTNNLVRELHQRSQPAIPPSDATLASESVWRLRAANPIFYGRESEVTAAVDLIVNKAPARVAILGPGGIGKTSIALAVLHDPRVQELYGNRRCFASCETTTTADAAARALADALGFPLESDLSVDRARHRLVQSLEGDCGIICLDNLETPLDADKRAVEDLLNSIAALSSIALLVTSRDTSIPTLKWTPPRLAHIQPFSQEAALATWNDICDFHDDDYTPKLIEVVDRMPLAVTLLARVASIEQSTKLVWDRWEAERTDMIRDGDQADRLYSVGASIEVSLRNHTEVAALLGVICIFPHGLRSDKIVSLDQSLNGRLGSLALLKQLSLVYVDAVSWDTQRQRIRVLSPIRHYMLQHHVSSELFLKFTDLVLQNPNDWDHDDILTFGWNRPGCHERCLQMVILSPHKMFDVEMMSQAIEKVRELEPPIQSELHRQIGYVLSEAYEFEKALSNFSKAIELDERLGDRLTLLEDWTCWIRAFRRKIVGQEDESERLDEVQGVIQKVWALGRNTSGLWDQKSYNTYYDLAWDQHCVNEGRRRLHMPVVHRSGLYSDNNSMVELDDNGLDYEAVYNQLVLRTPPPWDLSVILETITKSHRSSDDSTPFSGSLVPAESVENTAL